jgi:hypothetical protein
VRDKETKSAFTAPQFSPAWKKAHAQWLQTWVKHLAELGLDYRDYALYPVDEPGLTKGSVDLFLSFAKPIREADPGIRIYADTVIGTTLEELQRMAPYVDIWCLQRSGYLLQEGADKLALVKAQGKTVWTYECLGNVKHQSPLGYYRAQAWLAWRHGLTGIGFWSYCTSTDDPWFRSPSGDEYLLIYQGNGVVTSKRWEAVRDGVEDYNLLLALRRAADAMAETGKQSATVRDAGKLLGDEATGIAQFCDREVNPTLPGSEGLPGARRTADEQWSRIQAARRKLAALLATLTGNKASG